ncbi:inhibitor of growth protein 5 [Nematocida parisii]|uniref:PHD-type domain-containing protein n=1 Tax=Nematocida parisii (strain ERTm3) TaxID=935791 RepID=I3EJU5_NEMP3|nr:uncharacterized protein NEPG_00981 [Nematocida parisii ERTm1]EIJ89492.1 hypothetical protein NEQG_00262 [Nematocida parisii ERTm3]KAI5130908.1 inhibitor of growth protein 5 [Nematocida parisii]KAI5166726.1 inhibitor of growth protein 5 [Nematocida sp. AWRm79]KAI5186464.1 inhibitor of growth protein 5 [Nematocida sp. AWRm78]OAG30996.1 hypothetical protein NEIG_00593 [Nematocida sp. ERTm5]|eukprot:XP_013058809.1 hypothetical protein NEPG_00981 [Nematocida parisii ERTm1]
MLVQEYLSILEETPMEIQKVLVRVNELDHLISEEKKELELELEIINKILNDDSSGKGVDKERIDKQLQIINRSYLKLLDTDKKKLSLIKSLQNQLNTAKSAMKSSSVEFKEGIAKSSITMKLKGILSLLDYKIEEDNKEEEILCCTCKRPSKGEMIVCDNAECPIEWYHSACVGIKGTPKKKWVCNICTKE